LCDVCVANERTNPETISLQTQAHVGNPDTQTTEKQKTIA
jgi:hypothetical protein